MSEYIEEVRALKLKKMPRGFEFEFVGSSCPFKLIGFVGREIIFYPKGFDKDVRRLDTSALSVRVNKNLIYNKTELIKK